MSKQTGTIPGRYAVSVWWDHPVSKRQMVEPMEFDAIPRIGEHVCLAREDEPLNTIYVVADIRHLPRLGIRTQIVLKSEPQAAPMESPLADQDNWQLVYDESQDERIWAYTGPEAQPWRLVPTVSAQAPAQESEGE